MRKSEIDLEYAKELYSRLGNLHSVAKELHTSHIRLSRLFSENGVEVNCVGKARVLRPDEIQSAVDDYLVGHLTMEEIAVKHNVRLAKLRSIFRSSGVKISKWNGHIKKEKPPRKRKEKPVVEMKSCPYCGWKTRDVESKAHSFQKHLVHVHNVDIVEHLSKYPEDYPFLKVEKDRRDNKIRCEICGKWLCTIDNRHLAKHGINKVEYLNRFGPSKLVSDETKERLRLSMQKMMENSEWERKTSSYEGEISTFLRNGGLSFRMHDREVLGGLELDFVVGDVAIEFNGNKYHTEFFGGKGKRYHLDKLERCNDNGLKLVQIFEDEYRLHRDIVLSKLSHILRLDTNVVKISARKCEILEVSPSDAYGFLESNHLQGHSSSSVYLGAFIDGQLIGVMAFLNEGGGKWTLTRFATKIGTLCRGVGGKLFGHFVDTYEPLTIKSFADRRWTVSSSDNLYTKLGFELVKVLPPDYRYYNERVDKFARFHKFGFRKSTLSRKYGFPMEMTELEMVRSIGYDRIWDCGLFKYVWSRH